MKHSLLFSFAAAIAAILMVCGRDMPVSPNQAVTLYPGPGRFGVSHVQGLAKARSASPMQSGGRIGFDLGSIKGSAVFYFLLYNVGYSPITNVTIGFTDPHFAAYPAGMDTLLPGVDMGLLPLVKVNAVHGTAVDGMGYRPLMALGSDSALLTFSGSTRTRDGKDSTVVLTAVLSVRALAMDIEVRDDNGALLLATPEGRISGSFPDNVGDLSFYSAHGCSVTVKNTGNVPVSIKAYALPINATGMTFKDTMSCSVDTGRAVAIPIIKSDLVVSIDGNGAVADQSKLRAYPNGNCYLYLKGDPACRPDTLLDISSFVTLFYIYSTSCPNLTNRLFMIDSAMVFWQLSAVSACSNLAAGIRLYRLYGKTPKNLLASYQGEDKSFWTIEHYETPACKALLDTIRANLSASDLGLGKNHRVEVIIQ